MKRGFSLIEVLIAIMVLGIAVAGLLHGVSASLVSSKENELQTRAALLAAGRIELLRVDGYLETGQEQGEFEDSQSLFRWAQTIEETSVPGLFHVTVRVENTGTQREVYALETLLFDPPLETTATSERPDSREELQRGRSQQ